MEFRVIEEYPRYYVAVCKYGYRECFMKSEYTPIDQIIKKRKNLYDPNKIANHEDQTINKLIKKCNIKNTIEKEK